MDGLNKRVHEHNIIERLDQAAPFHGGCFHEWDLPPLQLIQRSSKSSIRLLTIANIRWQIFFESRRNKINSKELIARSIQLQPTASQPCLSYKRNINWMTMHVSKKFRLKSFNKGVLDCDQFYYYYYYKYIVLM